MRGDSGEGRSWWKERYQDYEYDYLSTYARCKVYDNIRVRIGGTSEHLES